jgi:hypothetical protein
MFWTRGSISTAAKTISQTKLFKAADRRPRRFCKDKLTTNNKEPFTVQASMRPSQPAADIPSHEPGT